MTTIKRLVAHLKKQEPNAVVVYMVTGVRNNQFAILGLFTVLANAEATAARMQDAGWQRLWIVPAPLDPIEPWGTTLSLEKTA